MIHESIEDLLLFGHTSLMIPADNCVTVHAENTLQHALMLLTTVGYSEIPVVDKRQRLLGLINMPKIMAGVKTELDYDWSLLNERKVKELIQEKPRTVQRACELEEILNALIEDNFVCVVGERQSFEGIITRKEILKRVTYMAHKIDAYYHLEKRERIQSPPRSRARNTGRVSATGAQMYMAD